MRRSRVTARSRFAFRGDKTTQIMNVAGVKTTIMDGYDAVGNRSSRNQDGTTYDWTYDAANRLVSQTSSTSARSTFVYDPEGNTLVKHEQGSDPMTMVYDVASRLTTSQQGAVRTSFTQRQDPLLVWRTKS